MPSTTLRRLAFLLAMATAAMLAQAPSAAAATFTVDTTADSGLGSLRQAIIDANAGPGNTIAFNIPGAGPHTIAPLTALPRVEAANTTIDGCTQVGADCSGLPLTLRIRLQGQGLAIAAHGITVRGISFTGSGTAITFTQFGFGAVFHLADDVTIADNYVGVAPDGSAAGNTSAISLGPGLRNIDSPDRLRIAGNVIGSNAGVAINASISSPFGTPKPITGLRITGNVIGLDPTGTEGRPNGGDAIHIDKSSDAQITGNRIVANGGMGIRHRGRSQAIPGSDPALDPGLLIQGNVVETNAAGGIVISLDPPPVADPYRGPVRVFNNSIRSNGAAGISITAAADTIRPNLQVGGVGPGQANSISGNQGPGVAIGASAADTSVAVTVRGNNIYGNSGAAIDLASDGPTANAPAGTTRLGPNLLSNHPVIDSATHGSVIVNGTYEGAPNTSYTLDFYASETIDGPQTWIGSTGVTTDAGGLAPYSAEFAVDLPEGWFVQATATDGDGNTSEFGNAVQMPPVPPDPTPPDPTPDPTPGAADPQPAPAPGPSRALAPPAHDLSIAARVSRKRVVVGDAVTYRLVVRNTGPDAAAGVTVTDMIPGRLDAQRVRSSRGTCSLAGNSARCSLGTLAAGQAVTIRIRAVAVTPGTARDAARVAAAPAQADAARNNTASAPVRVVKPVLGLAHSVDRAAVRAGGTAAYTIRVSNPSRRAIRSVRVCEALPAGLVHASSTPGARLSGGRYCWTVKRLAAGRSRTYTLTVRALPGASGRKVGRAVATSPNARPARASRALRVQPGAVVGGGVTG